MPNHLSKTIRTPPSRDGIDAVCVGPRQHRCREREPEHIVRQVAARLGGDVRFERSAGRQRVQVRLRERA